MILGKVAFIVIMIVRMIVRYPYRGHFKAKQKDRQEQGLLMLVAVGCVIIPFVYVFTNWLAFADYSSSLWIVGAGIVVVAAGLWLFWRSHADLGRNWSVSLNIQDDHTLVTQGVYHYVRHPMYSGEWLIMIAQALLLSNWIAGFSGLVAFGILYFVRVPKEEQMMLKEFGEQYQRYMAETGRVIPKRILSRS